MYWAKERRGGKIVHAEDAKAWGDYRCPTCTAEVFLRSGRRRADHFAHMPGQGKPDCENFHYSFDLSRAPYAAPAPYVPKHVDPLQLGIELEPDSEKRGARKWRLCLTVPKAVDAHGQITINLGGRDNRTISLTKLSLGVETYTAQPDMPDFGASWVSHEVRPEYRDAVQHRIPGLDPTMLNAFVATSAKQKPRTHSLSWGEGYYLVTRSDKSLTLPPSLPSRPLARLMEWDCVLAILPHEPSPEIEAWFSQHGDMSIARATRDWAVIYPAPFALGDEGDLHIHSSEYIVLALKSGSSASGDELIVSTSRSHATLELNNSQGPFVVLSGGARITENQIYLTWGGAYVATLATTPFGKTTAQVTVGVACNGPEGTVRAELHHSSSHTLLSEVRLGHRELVGLYGHLALHGMLRWQSPDTSKWDERAIIFSPHPNPRVDDELLRTINATLRDRSLEIDLDFGPFGRFGASASLKQVSTGPPTDKRLPPPLRARIEWLSRACRSYADKSRRPIAALSDTLLLTHLKRLSVPTKLLAHKRALDAQLQRLDFEAGHE